MVVCPDGRIEALYPVEDVQPHHHSTVRPVAEEMLQRGDTMHPAAATVHIQAMGRGDVQTPEQFIVINVEEKKN